LRGAHIGTMGWSYAFWENGFYPGNMAPKERLTYYATKFDTVETDSTFYRIPRVSTMMEWKEQTPSEFVFALKFPQAITHVKKLKDCQEETHIFIERVALLQEKLGPLLLQFPHAFTIDDIPLLQEFLQALPEEHRYVVEVRNEKLLNEEFYSILRSHNVALAWVEGPFIPQVNEMTSDFIYVRWEGDRRKINGTLGKVEADKTVQIKQWADRIQSFLDNKARVYGYFSKYYSGFPPSDVSELLKWLKTKK
jgi:uncharacterized protein YecE (DUF72 family)